MEFVENIRWRRGQSIDEIERNCILLYDGMNYTDQQIAQMLGRDIRTVRTVRTVIYYSQPYLMKKQINLFSIYLIKYDSKAIWAKTVHVEIPNNW